MRGRDLLFAGDASTAAALRLRLPSAARSAHLVRRAAELLADEHIKATREALERMVAELEAAGGEAEEALAGAMSAFVGQVLRNTTVTVG